MRQPPEKVFVGLFCIASSKLSPCRIFDALASALEAVQSRTPRIQPREFECYLEYTAVANGAPVRRADVSMAGATHGVELSLLEGTLVGVSLYLE